MWQLRLDSSPVAWAVVPRPDEQDRRGDWASVVTGSLRRQWDLDGDAPASTALSEAVAAVLRSQPEGVLADLVTWPMRLPLPLRVTFHVVDTDQTVDWESQGFEAAPFMDSPFGTGVQYSRRLPLELTRGIASIDAAIVFDRGDAALIARVHPCPIDVYTTGASTLADLIASCSLTDSNGRLFTTGRHEHLAASDADVWPEEGIGVLD